MTINTIETEIRDALIARTADEFGLTYSLAYVTDVPAASRHGVRFLIDAAAYVIEALAYHLHEGFTAEDLGAALDAVENNGGLHEAAEAAIPVYTCDRLDILAVEGWELGDAGLLPSDISIASLAGAILYEIAMRAVDEVRYQLTCLTDDDLRAVRREMVATI